MARGWESKSVEEQQSEFGKNSDSEKVRLSEDDKHKQAERRALELARANVSDQLRRAQNPRYVDLLTRELAELDRIISALA